MSREQRERFHVRTDQVLARFPQRRRAIDRARQEARQIGHEVEVYDAMAQVGAPQLWTVHPSGQVKAIELRTVVTELDQLQAGEGR